MVKGAMLLRRVLLSLLCALALFCAGCGEEYPYFSCDIRVEECQDEIYTGVAEFMGADPDMRPPIRTIGLDQFERELRDVDEEYFAGDDAWTRSLKLMGFLEEEADSFVEDLIQDRLTYSAAYYCGVESGPWICPVTPLITVIDRGGSTQEATWYLVHEVVHAIQEDQFGLSGIVDGTTEDELLILHSIVEGDASHFEEAWMHAVSGMPIDGRARWDELHANRRRWLLDAAGDSTFSFQTLVGSFPYAIGFEFMTGVILDAGLEGRAAVWGSPPSSSLAIMWGHEPPYALSNPEVAHPAPPPEYEFVFEDRMGAWYLFVFLRRLDVSEDIAWKQALAWAGDNFTVYRDGTSIAATWRIRFHSGSRDIAAAVASSVNRPNSVTDAAAFADGSDVYIIATENGSLESWDVF